MMNYENAVPIGRPGVPWVTTKRRIERVGTVDTVKYDLEVIEDPDNPLTLYSSRTRPEVMGEFYRNMPVPSQLTAHSFIMSRSHPKQNNRIAYLLSNPGVGKSYSAMSVGKARHPEGPMVISAGGKNLEFLLFQTVFDVSESRSLTKAIDDGLANGTLDRISVSALRQNFGKYFSEQSGRMCIDWKGLTEGDEITTDTGPVEKIDIDTIRKTLELVRANERWDGNKMNIGFKVKEGPLVIANRENRDLVIDELNKCKEGSETPLQLVWQVLNGELEEHTVTLGSNGTYTFRRGQGGSVVCTGNLPKDGESTHLISESFDRRVPAYRLPDFDVQDWQHRICQRLTGLPISTLHRMQKGNWVPIDPANPSAGRRWKLDDPEAFKQLLYKLRTLGMSEEEKRNVPEWQMSMLANWENVLNVSDHLANFYHVWSHLVDPQSPELQTPGLADVLQDVDDDSNPTAKVTASTMIRHIEAALDMQPLSKPAERGGGFDLDHDWNEPLELSAIDEGIEAKFGTRMVNAIMDEVYRSSAMQGKDKLYAQLQNAATAAGLTGTNPNIDIAKALNVDISQLKGQARARHMQGILGTFLRTEHPDLGLSRDDDHILPVAQVQAALEKFTPDEAIEISPMRTKLQVLNSDPRTVDQNLFRTVGVENLGAYEDQDDVRDRLPPSSLLSTTGLLTALALPTAGPLNLKALWNKALSDGTEPREEVVKIAQNQSPTQLAVATLLCRSGKDDDATYSKMHILHSGKVGKTLIVGDGNIAPALRGQLKRNGITYIDHNDRSAESTVNAEVRGMLESGQEALVKDAFLLRNTLREEEDVSRFSLSKLLTHPEETSCMIPNFVTALDPEKIPHVKRVTDRTNNDGGKSV